jgi:hypothetical protein
MRKILGVCLLVLLLTGSASAGIMPNGSAEPPPPTSQSTSAVQEPTDTDQEPALDGIMPNGVAESLTQSALDLLAILPSLL